MTCDSEITSLSTHRQHCCRNFLPYIEREWKGQTQCFVAFLIFTLNMYTHMHTCIHICAYKVYSHNFSLKDEGQLHVFHRKVF